MALQQCTCETPFASPASCPCTYSGLGSPVQVTCSRCNNEDQAIWPSGSKRKPWKALVLTCTACKHSSCVSFAGLPQKVQGLIAERCR